MKLNASNHRFEKSFHTVSLKDILIASGVGGAVERRGLCPVYSTCARGFPDRLEEVLGCSTGGD